MAIIESKKWLFHSQQAGANAHILSNNANIYDYTTDYRKNVISLSHKARLWSVIHVTYTVYL